jgi:hypothetical protein
MANDFARVFEALKPALAGQAAPRSTPQERARPISDGGVGGQLLNPTAFVATNRFAQIRRFGDDLIGDPAKTELEGQFVDLQQSYGWNI